MYVCVFWAPVSMRSGVEAWRCSTGGREAEGRVGLATDRDGDSKDWARLCPPGQPSPVRIILMMTYDPLVVRGSSRHEVQVVEVGGCLLTVVLLRAVVGGSRGRLLLQSPGGRSPRWRRLLNH